MIYLLLLFIAFGFVLPFGNSNPSARNPGSTSTTTNLEYFRPMLRKMKRVL